MIDLEKDIQYVKGIGPKKAYKLNKLGIFTLKDLLFYFPRQFEDRNNLKKIAQLQNDEKATIKAVIVSVNTTNPKKGMTLTKIDIKDLNKYNKDNLIDEYKSTLDKINGLCEFIGLTNLIEICNKHDVSTNEKLIKEIKNSKEILTEWIKNNV